MIKSKLRIALVAGLLMGSVSSVQAVLPECEDVWASGLSSTLQMSFGGYPGGTPGDESIMYDSNGTFVAPSYDTGAGDLLCPGSGVVNGNGDEICLASGSPRLLLSGLTFPGTHGAFYVEEANKGDYSSLDPTMYITHYDVTTVEIGAATPTYAIIDAWDNHGYHRVHTVTVQERLQIHDGSSLNCGTNGDVPGDPNDLFIVVAPGKQFQLGSNTCFSGYIYMEEDAQFQIGDSGVTIVGAISAATYNKLTDVNITYVEPTKSAPEICNGTDYNWTLVGIPAETGPANSVTVEDVFGDNLGVANYNTTPGQRGWTLFKRDFNTSANNSWYEAMDLNDTVTVTGHGSTLDRGEGYWLRSDPANEWDAEKPPLTAVNWNIANGGAEGCSVTGDCADYPLTLPDSTCAGDPSGPFRNIMIGYLGDTNASWADYGFYVDNTTPYTPGGMATAGYATDQIWQYDETNDDYDVCSSAMACDTPPYKGFWVQLQCGANEGVLTSIDLIIPNGK